MKFRQIRFLGLIGCARLMRDLAFSIIMFKFGVLIRWPFYIRQLGLMELSEDIKIGTGLVIDIFNDAAKLKIGAGLRAGRRLHIGVADEVVIGDNVLIADDVYISDHTHGSYTGALHDDALSIVAQRDLKIRKIEIGDNVWLGQRVCVFPGVIIGNNSIIGAHSIVKDSIPPNSIAAGVPAKVIKVYDRNLNQWIVV